MCRLQATHVVWGIELLSGVEILCVKPLVGLLISPGGEQTDPCGKMFVLQINKECVSKLPPLRSSLQLKLALVGDVCPWQVKKDKDVDSWLDTLTGQGTPPLALWLVTLGSFIR